MDLRFASIVLICVVLGSTLGVCGFLYFDSAERLSKLQSDSKHLQGDYRQLNQTYQALSIKYNELNASYQTLTLENARLKQDYNLLNSNYEILSGNYANLQNDYSSLQSLYSNSQSQYATLQSQFATLQSQYSSLQSQYSTLQSQYATLFGNYTTLSEAFDKPLSYEIVPATDELKSWLAMDQTDVISYIMPDFICGDFAVMLSQHAKLKHWDMGVVGVFGHTETNDPYAHAFNAIVTAEGLVYIEPQNDHVWWYDGHAAISENAWVEIDSEWIYVQDYTVMVWYD